MSFAANIPHFYALVRNQYLYDLQTGQGETTACLVFAVDSVEGHATGFDILTEWGGQFARLPIHALCWRTDAPERPLHQLQLWNNFSYSVEAVEYMALRQLTCAARIDDEDDEWLQGEYMFTLSWFGSQYAEQPGEGGFKRAHMIKLDEGNYALQPNNRMKWYEPSFVTKPFPDHPDFVTNSRVWNAEHRDEPWATEDSPTYYYKEQGGAFYKPAPQAPIKAAGGRLLAAGQNVTSFEGAPPTKRVAIQVWDSLEKIKAWRNSAEYKKAREIGDKHAKFRAFAVEGLPQ